MDYCNKSNQIQSYAPACSSGGGTDPFVAKNIDCVSLEADTVTCDALTINGDLISDDFEDIEEKIQYMSTSGNTTTYQGTLAVTESITVGDGTFNCDTINVDTIQPKYGLTTNFNSDIDVKGSVSCNSSLTVLDNATSGSTVASFLTSGLTTGETKIVFGKNATTSNSGELFYSRSDSTPANNHAGLRLAGSSLSVQVYSDKIVLPEKTLLSSFQLVPRLLQTFQSFTTGNKDFTISTSYRSIIKKAVIMFADWKKVNSTSTTIVTPLLTIVPTSGSVTYVGVTQGNNAAAFQDWNTRAGICLWNSNVYPTNPNYVINGLIECTYMGIVDAAKGERWCVDGQFSAYIPSDLNATKYYSTLSGYFECATLNARAATFRIARTADESSVTASGFGTLNCMFY